MPEPLGDRPGEMQRNTGAGDDHRPTGRSEIPCSLLDIGTRHVTTQREVVEIGFGDQLPQFRYAGGDVGAVLFVFQSLV